VEELPPLARELDLVEEKESPILDGPNVEFEGKGEERRGSAVDSVQTAQTGQSGFSSGEVDSDVTGTTSQTMGSEVKKESHQG
jgi:hypothetical protein